MARFFVIVGLSVVALGCRSNPACERQIGLMRAELLDLEDRYALLEAKYQEAVGSPPQFGDPKLEPYSQQGPANEVREAKSVDSDELKYDLDGLMMKNAPNATRRQIQATPPASGSVGFQPPPGFPSPEQRRSTDIATASYESEPDDAIDSPSIAESALPIGTGTIQVARFNIEFEPLMSSDDGVVDGIELGFSPVDSNGRPMEIQGGLTLAVTDPAEPAADAQRIGAWRFSQADLAASRGERRMSKSGVTLPLTWNNHRPRSSELILFVRYEPPGQSPIEARIPIDLKRVARRNALELESVLEATANAVDRAGLDSVPSWSPDR